MSRAASDWDNLAELDPLWSILSKPDKSGGSWDLHEFAMVPIGMTHMPEAEMVDWIASRVGSAVGNRSPPVAGVDDGHLLRHGVAQDAPGPGQGCVTATSFRHTTPGLFSGTLNCRTCSPRAILVR